MLKKQNTNGIVGSSEANKVQVGGDHYAKFGQWQHWDVVHYFNLGYFEGQITKYLFRWKDKGGVKDLEKAQHFLQKLIEIAKAEQDEGAEPGPGYVKQD